MTPSLSQEQVNTALGNFLTAILPSGTKIVVGQVNRVPSPEGDYVVMWPLRRSRLSTNVDKTEDAAFTGSIDGTTMTITEVRLGTMLSGAVLFGVGVTANTKVVSQTSGDPGGIGVYVVDKSQTIGPLVISSGATDVLQSTEVVMQVDVHGDNSADNAQTIGQLLRDPYAVQQMAGSGVAPLYAADPRQTPFLTAASQFEDRWSIEVFLEIDPTVVIPQQFADQATITPISVETEFPI